MPIHTYGLIPDRQDPRDCAAPMRITGALPPIVDLRDKCPPVYNQGQLGSCTANAIVGLREYWEVAHGKPLTTLSRLMLYYQERAMEGTIQEDAGAQIRDGMKALVKVGVCPETDWPYDISTFADKPDDYSQCLSDAAPWRINAYHRVSDLDGLRQQLAGGFPLVMGIQVYAGMESPATARTGIVKVPKKGERLLGGHAILAVGYNDHIRHVTIRNSWGAAWGAAGYGFLPYTYFSKAGLVNDLWTGA
jgi:C1A family cysteine protease